MSHDAWRDLLSPYLDGELAPAEAQRLASHLASCPECREALDRMADLSRSLRGLPRHAMPADVKVAIDRGTAAHRERARPVDRIRGWRMKAALPLAAAAMLVAIALAVRRESQTSPPTDAIAKQDAAAPQSVAQEAPPAAGELSDTLRSDASSRVAEPRRPAPITRKAERPSKRVAPPPAPERSKAAPSEPASTGEARVAQAAGAAVKDSGAEEAMGTFAPSPPAGAAPSPVAGGSPGVAAIAARPPIVARYRSDLMVSSSGAIAIGPLVPEVGRAAQALGSNTIGGAKSGSLVEPRASDADAAAAEGKAKAPPPSAPPVRTLRKEAAPASTGAEHRDDAAAPEAKAASGGTSPAGPAPLLEQLRGGAEMNLVYLIRLDAQGRIVSADPIGAVPASQEIVRAIGDLLVGSVMEPHDPRDPPLVTLEVHIPPIP